jgi:uncharacterized protein (DUF2062 family)
VNHPRLRDRLLTPLRAQLRQGTSPAQLALALALGGVLGIFPVLGATTTLCVVAGVALRLNQPAIQIGNTLSYPLQLLLYVPFLRAGAWCFGTPPVALTPAGIGAVIRRDPWGALAQYGAAHLQAVAVWAALAPLLALALAATLRPLLRRGRHPAAGVAPSETGEPPAR